MSNNCNNTKILNNNSKCNNSCFLESCLFSLPPKQFAIVSALFGVILSDDLDIDQKNALGNFLLNIGQTILTEAAQEQVLQSNDSKDDQIMEEIENLKKQVASLLKC